MFTKHVFNLFGLFLCLAALSSSIMATSRSRHGRGNMRSDNIEREERFSEKADRIEKEHPVIIALGVLIGVLVAISILQHMNFSLGPVMSIVLLTACILLSYWIVILFYMWLEPKQEAVSSEDLSSSNPPLSRSSGDKVMGLEDVPPAQMGLILDLILLFFILLGAFRGYKNGLFSQLFSSVAIFFFLMFGRYLFDNTITMLSYWWPDLDEGSISFLAIMTLFMSLLFVLFVLERILKRVLQLTFLGYFDSLLGGVVGVVQTSFFLATLISLIDLYGVKLSEEYTANMRIYNTIHSFVPRCMEFLQGYVPRYLPWLTEK